MGSAETTLRNLLQVCSSFETTIGQEVVPVGTMFFLHRL